MVGKEQLRQEIEVFQPEIDKRANYILNILLESVLKKLRSSKTDSIEHPAELVNNNTTLNNQCNRQTSTIKGQAI